MKNLSYWKPFFALAHERDAYLYTVWNTVIREKIQMYSMNTVQYKLATVLIPVARTRACDHAVVHTSKSRSRWQTTDTEHKALQ